MKIITIFPHDPFYEGIFSHVSVSVHCIFRKILSLEMHFFSNIWFQHVFQHLLKRIQEKTDLLFCFWFCDSPVIIVTFLPSLESADSRVLVNTSLFQFTSHNNNCTRSAFCTTLINLESQIM